MHPPAFSSIEMAWVAGLGVARLRGRGLALRRGDLDAQGHLVQLLLLRAHLKQHRERVLATGTPFNAPKRDEPTGSVEMCS